MDRRRRSSFDYSKPCEGEGFDDFEVIIFAQDPFAKVGDLVIYPFYAIAGAGDEQAQRGGKSCFMSPTAEKEATAGNVIGGAGDEQAPPP